MADAHGRGILDAEDFAVAMHLINGSMTGNLSTIPSSLPRSFYEQSDLQPPRLALPQLNVNIAGPSHSRSLLGASSPTAIMSIPRPSSSRQEWTITSALRAHAGHAFDAIDTQRTGYVAGSAVYTFMLDSGLPMEALARIWYIFMITYIS